MSRCSSRAVVGVFLVVLMAWGQAQAMVLGVTQHTNVGATFDLDAATVYTHKLDFPADGLSAPINGVQFSAVGAGTNLLDPLTGKHYSLTMNNPSDFASGSSVPLTDFIHNGSQGPGAVETLTMSDLTPGEYYDLRLYYRDFGPRPNAVTANLGAGPVSLGILDEYPVGASNQAYWSIIYRAESSSLVLSLSQQNNNDSWHEYLVSNQVVVPEPATLSLLALGGLALVRRRRRDR